jgi:hypothetical protein
MASCSCGIEALMLGSFIMLAGNFLIVAKPVGKVGDNSPGEGDIRRLDLDARAL